MTSSRRSGLVACALTLSIALVATPGPASAGPYPTIRCVGAKLKAAALTCRKDLRAWAKWDRQQDATRRDEALVKNQGRFSQAWARAERSASDQGVDCAQTTISESGMRVLIDTAVSDVVALVNTGLDLSGSRDHQRCGSRRLGAAAGYCDRLIRAESRNLSTLARDPSGVGRDANQTRALTAFLRRYDDGCGPTPAASVQPVVDDLSADALLASIVSPNVDPNQFTTISPTGTTLYESLRLEPICMDRSPYHFFAKRGSVNKLLMYYQGGGACWDPFTCSGPVCNRSVDPIGGSPNGFSSGFADLSNPDNPFKDWHIVFVSYCSCDVHFGDTTAPYKGPSPPGVNVEHRGFQNAKFAEKWAREHFVNPESIFVTGSSAGAYGALFHAGLLHDVWPASNFDVLADAGNGVITADFLQNEFSNWNFKANLPKDPPGLVETIDNGTGLPAFLEIIAEAFPNSDWAQYTSAYDGGTGGQTGFYNIMLNNNNPLAATVWWQGSCAFNTVMRQQAFDVDASVDTNNYRYYIASGSQHTTWGSNRVYSDTTGGVPLFVDWIDAMLTDDPNWENVEASPFNVLRPGACSSGSSNPGTDCQYDVQCPGGSCQGEDVRPNPLALPFEIPDANDPGLETVISCP